ncbi:MAG TPA: ATP-binding protein [Solirubrobacteraceae bacterium]|jgi:two-component system sensor histidine kinase KdpD
MGADPSPRRLSPLLLRPERPSRALGVLVALGTVAAATGLIYPLKHVAPVISLGVVYLVGVVVVAMLWGLVLGVATAILSVAAFSFFHLPPVGRFTLADGRNWVALCAFVAVAVAMGFVAGLARSRARELEERRREADLASELAQLLLGADSLPEALPQAAERLAAAIGVSSAAIELGQTRRGADGAQAGRHAEGAGVARAPWAALPLGGAPDPIGALLLPDGLSEVDRARVLARVVPSLESILAAALHRSELQAEVVETAALRRSDEMKTAVLRSVSHDLRTPVTAILTAAGALDPALPSAEKVGEVRELVLDAATRLWLLIEKLLDLSMLQSGQSQPVSAVCSIEEVLAEAVEQARAERGLFQLSLERELPPIEADPAQLERAFANVLENAARYSAGKPVSVRARAVAGRLRVRIVDQGPGIHPAEQERVFLPFYRSADAPAGHHGSGLGLAIAKGFVEVNGGRIAVESTPGQGTSVVVEFPLGVAAEQRETAAAR